LFRYLEKHTTIIIDDELSIDNFRRQLKQVYTTEDDTPSALGTLACALYTFINYITFTFTQGEINHGADWAEAQDLQPQAHQEQEAKLSLG